MKYNITHKCGHESTMNLTGPYKERESRIEWLSSQDCTDCYRAAQLEAAKAKATAENMAELQGSEKQIAWAETIRAKKISQISAIAEGEQDKNALHKLYRRNMAIFWINRRDSSAQSILAEAVRREMMLSYKKAHSDMPALEGTPEQVAQAEDIRAMLLAEIEALIDSAKPYIADMPAATKAKYEASCADAEWIAAQTSAEWWLGHKNSFGKIILKQVGEQRVAATTGGRK